jgi:hypothetical protein
MVSAEGQSSGAENNGRHAAAASYRAAGIESRNLISGPGQPGPDLLEYIQAMFNCATPRNSGNLAGESFASALENNPRCPALRRRRHRALFELLDDDIVADHLSHIAPHLRGLESGVKIYRAATLTAFRAAFPVY